MTSLTGRKIAKGMAQGRYCRECRAAMRNWALCWRAMKTIEGQVAALRLALEWRNRPCIHGLWVADLVGPRCTKCGTPTVEIAGDGVFECPLCMSAYRAEPDGRQLLEMAIAGGGR